MRVALIDLRTGRVVELRGAHLPGAAPGFHTVDVSDRPAVALGWLYRPGTGALEDPASSTSVAPPLEEISAANVRSLATRKASALRAQGKELEALTLLLHEGLRP